MTSSPKTVTKKDIDDLVAKSQVKFTHYDNKLTHCVITLPCGFTVTGESTCNNPADFNKEDGEKYALAKADNELWPLEYYRLAFEAYQASQNPSSAFERLLLEQEELQDKLNKLNTLLEKSQPIFINDEQWGLLHEQQGYMTAYSKVLKARIEGFVVDKVENP